MFVAIQDIDPRFEVDGPRMEVGELLCLCQATAAVVELKGREEFGSWDLGLVGCVRGKASG